MFCSEKCLKETYKKFDGKPELIQNSLQGSDIRQKVQRILNTSLSAVGDFDELQNIVDTLNNQTIFDFDFSDDDELRKKVLICVSSLMPKTDCGLIIESVENSLNIPESSKRDFFVCFISLIILNYMRNGLNVPSQKSDLSDCGMLLPFVSLMNHSCDPNLYWSFIENKCYVFVIKPIPAGEQVFISYR
jgi:SET domain